MRRGSALVAVMRKEFIQTLRDRRMLPLLIAAPLLQTLVFGFAVNLDLEDQPLVVADEDRSPASRALVQRIATAEGFSLLAVVGSAAEAEDLVWRGDAALMLDIPRGWERASARSGASLALALDGSDANTAVRAGQELGQILGQDAQAARVGALRQALATRSLPAERMLAGIRLEPQAWFNPELKTAVFLVPGVLAMVLAVITMVLTAMGLTREREVGTLEQLMVTPLKPWELILGKTLPFAAFGLADVALVAALAFLVFDVPLRGSMVSVFFVSALYLMTTLGTGIFLSTVSSSQQQALLNAFFVILPALMLSGYVFPVEHMPAPVQWLTVFNPLRHYIDLMRALMVQGGGLEHRLGAVAGLAGIGALVLIAASLRFRKRIG